MNPMNRLDRNPVSPVAATSPQRETGQRRPRAVGSERPQCGGTAAAPGPETRGGHSIAGEFVCIYLHIDANIYSYMICVYIYIYIWCVYIYIYIYDLCIHIYIYIYIYDVCIDIYRLFRITYMCIYIYITIYHHIFVNNEILCFDFMILWFYDIMILWYNDIMICDFMVIQC